MKNSLSFRIPLPVAEAAIVLVLAHLLLPSVPMLGLLAGVAVFALVFADIVFFMANFIIGLVSPSIFRIYPNITRLAATVLALYAGYWMILFVPAIRLILVIAWFLTKNRFGKDFS